MLLRPRLARIDAGFGIDLLSLEATETGPCESTQDGFAEEGAAAYDPGPLIDALSNRLGQDAVMMAHPRASHIPERSETWPAAIEGLTAAWNIATDDGDPAAIPRLARGKAQPKSNPSVRAAAGGVRVAPPSSQLRESAYVPPWPYGKGARRPPFLLARPEPIAVIAQVPDGPPARFTWRRVERRVARAQGPERIAPEWWRMIGRPAGAKAARARDYFEIEDEAGAVYWVFRHGLYGTDEEGQEAPPAWFLHGLF
jgi:protein ImuB